MPDATMPGRWSWSSRPITDEDIADAANPRLNRFVATRGDATMPSHASQSTQEPLTGLPAGDARTPPVSTSPTYACGGCVVRWSGVSRAHCSACHRTFAGIAPFDLHRRGGECLDPEQIAHKESGDRLLFLTNGMWSSVEDPKPRGQHLRRRTT